MTFQFDTINDWFVMAGHGPYVWGSYGVTLVVLLYLVVSPLRKRKRLIAQQRRLQRINSMKNDRKQERNSTGEVA